MKNQETINTLHKNHKMKYIKILIDIKLWHLKPYKTKGEIGGYSITEFGFLCFKLVIVWE